MTCKTLLLKNIPIYPAIEYNSHELIELGDEFEAEISSF